MDPLLQWIKGWARRKSLLNEVLNGFDVVVGGGLEGLDSRRGLAVEVVCDGTHERGVIGGQGCDLRDLVRIAQEQHPLTLHTHSVAHETVLAGNRRKRTHLTCVAPVGGTDGKER